MKRTLLAVVAVVLAAICLFWRVIVPAEFLYDLIYLLAVPTVYLPVALFDLRIASSNTGVLYVLLGVVLTIMLGRDLQAFTITVKIAAAMLGSLAVILLRRRIAAIIR